jgi:membrane-bound metal-dependent hydrolase YbcI (DUF457 family)
MPSSVGHGLAGMAAGWAIARPASPTRALLIQAATFAVLGAAADLDLLVGRHSAETHSLGAAAIVAGLAAWGRWPIASGRWRIGLAAFAAWATHPLLDSLAVDTLPPIGIMAFWPISTSYVQTGLAIFAPISHRLVWPGIITRNFPAMAREVMILLPITIAVWWWRSSGRPAPPTR